MQIRGIRRLVVVCAAIAVASATMVLAPPAWSSDNVNLASVQPKVPFTVYAPTFTAGLPLLSVKVSKFDPQAVGGKPGQCTYYLKAQYGNWNPSLTLTESFPCSDEGFPMLKVASFHAKGSQVFINTNCPNTSAVGEADCATGSTATPAELLLNNGSTWIVLPARGGHQKTQAQLNTHRLNAKQIERIVRSLSVAN